MSSRHERPIRPKLPRRIEQESVRPLEWKITLPGRMQEIAPTEPSQPIQVSVRLPEDIDRQPTLRVLLYAHGQGGWPDPLASLLNKLRTENGLIIVTPLTSRRDGTSYLAAAMEGGFDERAMGINHRQRLEKFSADKFFADEVEDFRRGFDIGLQSIVEKLGNQRPIEITMMGTSLGGPIVAQLSAHYHPAQLIMHGAPLNLQGPDRVEAGIGPQAPTAQDILGSMQAQRVLAIRGEHDTAVTRAETEAYASSSVPGSYVEIPDFGHSIYNPQSTSGQLFEHSIQDFLRR